MTKKEGSHAINFLKVLFYVLLIKKKEGETKNSKPSIDFLMPTVTAAPMLNPWELVNVFEISSLKDERLVLCELTEGKAE